MTKPAQKEVWLDEMIVLDMILMGWLGLLTSTQNKNILNGLKCPSPTTHFIVIFTVYTLSFSFSLNC